MTNTEFLENRIEKSGLKKEFIAEKLGLTRFGLHKKICNQTEFKASEIVILTELLNLNDSEKNVIFFNEKDE